MWGRAHCAPSTETSQPESETVKQNTDTRRLITAKSSAAAHPFNPRKPRENRLQQNHVANQPRRWVRSWAQGLQTTERL